MTVSLVLLPGSACDDRMFASQLAHFGSTATYLPIDDHDTIEALAASVLERAPDRFALMGLSMGGIVAAQVATLAGDRLAGLALFDTNLGLADEQQLEARTRLASDIRAGWFDRVITRAGAARLTADPELHTDLILDMARDAGPQVLLRQNNALLRRRDRRDDLASLRCPTLLACGAEDQLCPPSMHADLQARASGAHLTVIDGAGHLATIDQPAVCNRVLEGWLEMCSTNQPRRGYNHEYT